MKITKTESYQDYMNLCMVTRGKLILVEEWGDGDMGEAVKRSVVQIQMGQGQVICYNPYIIAPNEPLPANTKCKVWNSFTKAIEDYYGTVECNPTGIDLVIVEPNQFSKDIIVMIETTLLKNDSEILVECAEVYVEPDDSIHCNRGADIMQVRLTHRRSGQPTYDGHAHIIPILFKDPTWEDIEQEYIKEHPAFSAPYPGFDDWLKKNYNVPTRKVK